MKYFLSFTIIISLIFTGCKEVPPPVDLATPAGEFTTFTETPEAPQAKVVLIEEFSGVECTNCPKGHVALENIIDIYGNDVAVVSLHAASCPLTNPIPPGEDLRTNVAEDIVNLVGDCGGIPAAMFDRRMFPPEQDEILSVPTNTWQDYVDQSLQVSSPVNLYLQKDYDEATNTLAVDIEIHYVKDMPISNSLTIYLTESKIITPQDSLSVRVNEYEQNHILRTALTPNTGQLIPTEKEAGRVLIGKYSTTLQPNWNPDNMEVIAFVHTVEDSLTVLQAAHNKVKE